jgi:hypothetical protein
MKHLIKFNESNSNDYQKQLERVKDIPKYYLGQEVTTNDGDTGIIIGLKMPTNGLYIEPERIEVTIWFGMDNGVKTNKWIQHTYYISDLKKEKPE